jgi:hypothetical protein
MTGGPTVRIDTQPMWRLRASLSATRWILYAVAIAGVAATVRFAVAPPREPVRVERVDQRDAPAEAFAALFTRAYLTWIAAKPQIHQADLAPFVSSSIDPDLGLRTAQSATDHVLWTQIVQDRRAGPREHVYTVAAQTDSNGLLQLSVDVVRGPDGRLRLARYPALIGGPLTQAATSVDGAGLGEIADPGLAAVVTRGLTNYLADSRQNLAADLLPGAGIAPPSLRLSLQRILDLRREPDGSVLAIVVAQDPAGDAFTLSYVVAVTRAAGRWEIGAVESDPLSP